MALPHRESDDVKQTSTSKTERSDVLPHRAHIFIALLSANCSEKIFRAGNPHSAIFNNERIIKFWNCRKREFANLALAIFAARRETTVNNEFAQRTRVKVNGACFSQKKQDEKLVSESKVCDANL